MTTENTVDAVESAIESGFDDDGNISDEDMATALTGGEVTPPAEPAEPTEPAEPAAEATPAESAPTEPEATPAEPAAEATPAEPTPAEPTPAEPAPGDNVTPPVEAAPEGVASKDGSYIIPYDDLIKEREGRHAERDRADSLQKELDDIKAGAEAGVEVEMSDEMKEFIEEFPAVGQMLQQQAEEINTLKSQLTVVATDSIVDKHFAQVADAHSDYREVLDSQELKTWIEGQSPILRDAYQSVYDRGTAGQLTELITTFKGDTKEAVAPVPPEPTPSATPVDPAEVKKKADEAEEKASKEQPTPSSLTEVPGTVTPHEESSALIDMPQASFMDKMSNRPAAEQLALLDKML